MKWKSINDNFGRRSGIDRRKEDNTVIKEDRRKLNDRRKVTDRRIGTERRKEPDFEDAEQTGKDKRKNPVDRRDFIFPDD
jgi:hypothetical protein